MKVHDIWVVGHTRAYWVYCIDGSLPTRTFRVKVLTDWLGKLRAQKVDVVYSFLQNIVPEPRLGEDTAARVPILPRISDAAAPSTRVHLRGLLMLTTGELLEDKEFNEYESLFRHYAFEHVFLTNAKSYCHIRRDGRTWCEKHKHADRYTGCLLHGSDIDCVMDSHFI